MFSTKNSSPQKKPPFYYIAHPHEAFLQGFNAYLGNGNDSNVAFQAFTYFLPMDTIRLVPRINDYFHALIAGRDIHHERMRRKSFLESVDAAIGALHRTDYMNSTGSTIVIGSKHIKPVTWAVIGRDTPSCKMYRFQFYNIYALIDHYTKKYEEPCHCGPVCLYHQPKGREAIEQIIRNSPDRKKVLSQNIVVAAAIHFLADLLEHCGPDVDEYFDLFTNDLTCGPDSVDLDLWLKCRERALFGTNPVPLTPPKRQIGFVQGPPPPPPKPMRIRVVVTEEGVDDLTVGTKTTQFTDIDLSEDDDIERQYREYYCGY